MKRLCLIFSIFLVIGVSLYVRTYAFRAPHNHEEIARESMLGNLKRHLAAQIDKSLPNMPAHLKEQMLEQKVDELISKDKENFEQSVEKMAREIKRRGPQHSTEYLNGSDSYYYYSLTENIEEMGIMGPAKERGQFYNPLRHAPFGKLDLKNIHPHVGYSLFLFLRLFNEEIKLMKAVAFTPLVTVTLTIVAFFILCQALNVSVFSSLMGCLFFMLSPIVIQRSNFGWYDTDPYSLLFSALILLCFLFALRDVKKAFHFGMLGGMFTGIYACFWQGWSLIWMLVLGGGVFLFFFDLIIRRGMGVKDLLKFWSAYLLSSAVFVSIFMTPHEFIEAIKNSVAYFYGVSDSSSQIWPNLLMMIGETNNITVKKWVYLTANYGVVLTALIGSLLAGLQFFQKKDWVGFRQWLVMSAIFLPLTVFSLSAERFSLMSVLPMCVLLVLSLEAIVKFSDAVLGKLPFLKAKPQVWRALPIYLLLMVALLPRTVIGARVAGNQTHLLMTDAWHQALTELKQSSSENTVVFSWWSPGYFINAIARRPVVVDGGTHSYKENYWIAKALMSRSEREGGGIFRMLASSGNESLEFLESMDWGIDDAVELIETVTAKNRDDAKLELPKDWSSSQKEAFLKLTHGDELIPPSYVIVYEGLLDSNVMLKVLANWDFEKAKEILGGLQTNKKDAVDRLKLGSAYARNMFRISNQVVPHHEGSHIVKQEGAKVYFDNRLVFDRESKTAYFLDPSKGPEPAKPVHLIIKEGEKWEFIKAEGYEGPLAAFIKPHRQKLMVKMVDKDLSESLLYKLTFGRGKGLKWMKSFVKVHEPSDEDYIEVFEIDWDSFNS